MNLEDRKLQKYQYAAVVGGVTLVGVIVAWFLILSPLYASTKNSGVELATKEKNYSDLVAKKDKLDKLKDQEAELKKQATTVSDALPKDEEVGRLFIQLDALAKGSNGKLRSVVKTTSTSSTTGTTELATTGITKTVYTLPLDLPTYFDLKSFINNSESALRLFSINDFNITASDAGALTVTLTANSYTRN